MLKLYNHHGMIKDIHYTINMQDYIIQYPNWSKIYFVPLATKPSDPDFNRLWWYEITYGWIGEVQECDRKSIDVIITRLTEKVKEYNLTGKILMTCNPDKGHLYTDFIKAQSDWTILPSRVCIQSLYTDNPHIDHDKYKESLANADKVTKERLLYGNWEYDNTPWRLIEYDKILDIRTNTAKSWNKYITCDPARFGQDKAIIRVRDWLNVIDKSIYDYCDATIIENKIREYATRYTVPMSNCIIDEDWMWWPIVDHLKCKWFVNNSKALNGENYRNLKTQCYFKLAEYINKGMIGDKTLDDHLIQELDVLVQVNMDKDWALEIISKDKIKEQIGRSPDESDSMMMRMWWELGEKKQRDLSILSYKAY